VLVNTGKFTGTPLRLLETCFCLRRSIAAQDTGWLCRAAFPLCSPPDLTPSNLAASTSRFLRGRAYGAGAGHTVTRLSCAGSGPRRRQSTHLSWLSGLSSRDQ
jgi:hypothetical protein